MEVNLLMGSSDKIKEPILVSNSTHSQTSAKPGQLLLTEKEADKCKHFTIRGFVSEVRIRNPKICWPFSMHDQTSDGDAPKMLPLDVKEFRRWWCETCVAKTIPPEASTENRAHTTNTENRANMTNTNDGEKGGSTLRLGDPTKASGCETIKLLNKSQQQSEEKCLEEVEVQKDSSAHITNCQQKSLLHCDEKHDKSQVADLIEDINVNQGGYNRFKENQSLMCTPNATAEQKEACHIQEREQNGRADNSEIVPIAEDTPGILPCEQDTTTVVHQTGGSGTSEGVVALLRFTPASSDKEQDQGLTKLGKRKELEGHAGKAYRMAMGVDRGGAMPSSSVPAAPHDSKCLAECSDEAPETSIHLTEDMLDHHDAAQKLGILVEKPRARKSRKMRTLNEIINSEGQKNDDKKYISSLSAGASGSANIETLDTSKQKDEHPNQGCHLVQNTEAAEIKRKNRKEAVPSNGEGTLLIDWLKTVPKKANLHKGEADREFKRELTAKKKRTEVEVLKPSIPREDSTVQKGDISRQAQLTEKSGGKRAGIVISDKELETHGSIPKKGSPNNKNKRPLVEDGTSSEQCFKEPSVPEAHRETKKKQRIVPISEPEAVDGFTMEICEVLSNMNAENDKANMSKLSEMTVGGEDANGQGGEPGDHASKVLDAVPANRCLSGEIPHSSNTGSNNGDDRCRSGASHSSGGSKRCHQFDLNQEASASADFQESSPFVGLSVSGAQLAIVDSNRNYSPRSLSAEGLKMAASSSNTIDRTVAAHNLFQNSIDGSSGFLNGYTPRINVPNIFSGFDSGSIYPGVNRQDFVLNADYQTSAKLSKDNAESSIYKGPFAEPGNGYSSNLMWPVNYPNNASVSGNGYIANRMQPVNVPNNGTDSAVNLFGLMQHSPGSAEPNHSSVNNAYMGYLQAIHGLGWDIVKSPVADPKMLSDYSSNGKLDKQPGDPCVPLRPRPRNILGPLLQMEVNNTPNDVAPTLGFGSNNQSMLTFRNSGSATRESNALASDKGKAKASLLAPARSIQPSTSLSGAFEKVGPSLVSRATPGSSPSSSKGIGQVVTGSADHTSQPLRSTTKMEKCLLNRNPADFAAPDEESEYMIGYKERNIRDLPRTYLLGRRGQKMRRLNDLNRSRTSKKPSLSRFCPRNAK